MFIINAPGENKPSLYTYALSKVINKIIEHTNNERVQTALQNYLQYNKYKQEQYYKEALEQQNNHILADKICQIYELLYGGGDMVDCPPYLEKEYNKIYGNKPSINFFRSSLVKFMA